MKKEQLIKNALMARQYSYSPYSHYKVGACLVTEDGTYVSGCNVENASYGLCNCAERTAVFKAVSMGYKRIKAIAIVGGSEEGMNPSDYAYPCGACRQVIREFSGPDTRIYVAKSEEEYKEYSFSELLPDSFGPDNLK